MRGYVIGLLAATVLSACATPGEEIASRGDTASQAAGAWRLEGRAMAAAADPRAVEAALGALRAGGNAVDAAIAAHAVLGLVEPQSSGLGGGGFMVVFMRKTGTVSVFDGRETAPSTASPALFDVNGQTMGFGPSIFSGRSVGAPGAVALYDAAHRQYGALGWDKTFEAAIRLADEGFIVSPRLAQMLDNPRFKGGPLAKGADSGAYFYPAGKPLASGDRRTNPAYADVLRGIVRDGPSAFYTGKVADGIVAAVRGGDVGGELTLADLAGYKLLRKDALCAPYRDYRVCSAPPASSGGVAMNQILSLYALISAASPDSGPDADLRDFVLAQQLGYADRDHYVADPAAVTVPVADLLNPKYLASRAGAGFKPGDAPQPGDPGALLHGKPMIDMWGRDASAPQPGTTHLSVVDFDGNAVSMTMTVESPFGSSRFTHGFLLNNELTDFSRPAAINGKPVANAPGPGKRPRSSMSPTIVLDAKGDVFMVTGSPGGNSIVGYVSKSLVAVLDWGRTAQDSAALPNIVARGQTVRVEASDDQGKAWAKTLADQGFKVQSVTGEVSGVHAIVARPDRLEGGADPRREGVAVEISR
jgi:gamma-glutamyltranspeptidase / glutathione hydrolase